VDKISEVLPFPFSSNTLIDKILASGAIPLYFPLEEYPFPASIPAQ